MISSVVNVAKVIGTNHNDIFIGNNSNNILITGAGNDIVRGAGGDDTLEGGLGSDQMFGEAGNDVLRVEDGNDTVDGGSGIDRAVFSGNRGDYLFAFDPTSLYLTVSDLRGLGKFEVRDVEQFQFADNTVTLAALKNTSTVAGLVDGLSPSEQLELIYIGYFGRAGDAYGFSFWSQQSVIAQNAGQSPAEALSNIANAFQPQPETLSQYPLLGRSNLDFSSPSVVLEVGNLVRDVYLNLFDHLPDADGKAYWTGQITSGAFPIGKAILAIANGAIGSDAAILLNKIATATDFTSRTAEAGLGFAPSSDFLATAAWVLEPISQEVASISLGQDITTSFVGSGNLNADVSTYTELSAPALVGVSGASSDLFGLA